MLDKLVHNRELKQLEGARVQGITFGSVPPNVRYCRSRYDPVSRYLQLELEADFAANGFAALFDLTARPPSFFPNCVALIQCLVAS